MIDVLSSIVDVNQRFRRLVLDSLYIRDLNITSIMNINSHKTSINTQVLSRICSNILPQIHSQVHKLTVEQDSMKQILHAANYPQLYSLSLVNCHEVTLHRYLTSDLILRDLLAKQITHLNIDMKKPEELCSEIVSNMFALILSLCKKLIALDFCDMFPIRQCQSLIFHVISKISISSTLIKLKINVVGLLDCLYILDGPFVCLSTLIINIGEIFHPCPPIDPKKKLRQLKCLSFIVRSMTSEYNELLVPLFCRMINLEEFKLYLYVGRFDSTYIDGIQLYDQFLIYMTQLKKFTFNINTVVDNMNVKVKLPSNEDIQRSFIGRGYQKVASYVNIDSSLWDSECHIYSLPYDFEFYVYPDNPFHRGIFHKVRKLKMSDGNPFEHKLFKIISQDFPFLEFLYIFNDDPVEDKQYSSTLITFPYLTFLDLNGTHVDYAELFLLDYGDIVRFLLEHSAKVEETNEKDHIPPMETTSGGHVEVARALLDHGADVNTRSNDSNDSMC
ncbi:unnamed protein product [Rotaria sordida]|uniref:Uncharacterized protein n=1 Tax=Rotaria sordida TaxID=392033 RepID=A0A819X8T2_9BILA|nr:unnamed protein product [Rotaria sordida]